MAKVRNLQHENMIVEQPYFDGIKLERWIHDGIVVWENGKGTGKEFNGVLAFFRGTYQYLLIDAKNKRIYCVPTFNPTSVHNVASPDGFFYGNYSDNIRFSEGDDFSRTSSDTVIVSYNSFEKPRDYSLRNATLDGWVVYRESLQSHTDSGADISSYRDYKFWFYKYDIRGEKYVNLFTRTLMNDGGGGSYSTIGEIHISSAWLVDTDSMMQTMSLNSTVIPHIMLKSTRKKVIIIENYDTDLITHELITDKGDVVCKFESYQWHSNYFTFKGVDIAMDTEIHYANGKYFLRFIERNYEPYYDAETHSNPNYTYDERISYLISGDGENWSYHPRSLFTVHKRWYYDDKRTPVLAGIAYKGGVYYEYTHGGVYDGTTHDVDYNYYRVAINLCSSTMEVNSTVHPSDLTIPIINGSGEVKICLAGKWDGTNFDALITELRSMFYFTAQYKDGEGTSIVDGLVYSQSNWVIYLSSFVLGENSNNFAIRSDSGYRPEGGKVYKYPYRWDTDVVEEEKETT